MEPTDVVSGMSLGHVGQRLTPIKSEIDSQGNEGAEDRPEDAPLAHVEPVGLDFDDGNSAVALKIHVDRVNDREGKQHFGVQTVRDHQVGQRAQSDIGQTGTSRPN